MRFAPHSKRGFTLVEILLVVAILAFLSITAVSNLLNSNKGLDFINNYRQIMDFLRLPRVYAINNQTLDGAVPSAYGIFAAYVPAGKIFGLSFFADTDSSGSYTPNDKILKSASWDFSDYDISLMNSAGVENMQWPVLLIYESGTAKLTSYSSFNQKVPITDNPFFAIKVGRKDQSIFKYILIFQVSGLIEESDILPGLSAPAESS